MSPSYLSQPTKVLETLDHSLSVGTAVAAQVHWHGCGYTFGLHGHRVLGPALH